MSLLTHKIKKTVTISMLMLLPVVIHAQAFKNFAGGVVNLINRFVYVVMGFALIFFLYGMVQFIATAGNDQSREQGKQFMVWGIIALFVMVGVWGLVAILHNTFFEF